VSAIVTKSDNNKGIKLMKENNTTHSTDDAAIFSMETHTSMNRIQNKCRLLVNTL
jgi:hypothetical protein